MATRILRRGAKGEDVGDVQIILKAKGFDVGVVDDYFGPRTEMAVKAFQVVHNLLADGAVGPATFAALGIEVKPEVPVEGKPEPKYKTLAEVDAHLEKGTADWYQAAYLILKYDAGTEGRIEQAARRVLQYKPIYQELEKLRGIPWAMTGLIHSMECNNNMRGCLHNGDLIIGNGKKTHNVPRGRGPFATWLEAALDAVSIDALWRVPNWSVGYMLKQMEKFNGMGYLQYHHRENSPYLWACTNINDGTGKYVSDGQWGENADANTQEGSAALLHKLEAWGEVNVSYL